ncbi:ACT domain-containing protein [Halopelagius fulvigenes]|uniref:ACT domain-containing protein n=1 Tax=Halopelagius fulvigenes TaxID=1198324 RepID=A0ABD5U2N7_9EURY
MELAEYFDGGTVSVSESRYAVLKATRDDPDAFASVRDGDETTVVVEQDAYDEEDAIEAEEGWRILTFETTLPFELVGFLAVVAGALAEESVSVFALSAHSTDHVLVKDDDIEPAVRKLEALGCRVER